MTCGGVHDRRRKRLPLTEADPGDRPVLGRLVAPEGKERTKTVNVDDLNYRSVKVKL